jgi:hypothetical protein
VEYTGKPPDAALLKNYFDREPVKAITAVEVRELKAKLDTACHLGPEHVGDANCGEFCSCIETFHRTVLDGLRNHPGINAAARAVVEAALE